MKGGPATQFKTRKADWNFLVRFPLILAVLVGLSPISRFACQAKRLPTSLKNTPPRIQGTVPNQPVNDEESIRPFASVAISDAEDGNGVLRLMVRITNPAAGSFSDLNGLNPDIKDFYVLEGPAIDLNRALQGMVFTPHPNRIPVGASETVSFQVRAIDPLELTAIDNNASLVIHSINNAPTILGDRELTPIQDNEVSIPFHSVDIHDPDNDAAPLSISVFFNPDEGFWTSTEGFQVIANAPDTHLLFKQGSIESLNASIKGLSFVPRQNHVAVGLLDSIAFGIVATDSQGAESERAEFTLLSGSVNDPPTLEGVPDTLSIEDHESIRPYISVIILDPDPSPERFEATLRPAVSADVGEFRFPDEMLAEEDGSRRILGTQNEIENLLEKVLFVARPDTRPVGAVDSAFIELTVQDAFQEQVVGWTEIQVLSVNDAPRIHGIVTPIEAVEGFPTFVFPEIQIDDPDVASNFLIVEIHYTPATDGEFLNGDAFESLPDGGLQIAGTPEWINDRMRLLEFRPEENRVAPGFQNEIVIQINVRDRLGTTVVGDPIHLFVDTINQPPTIQGAQRWETDDKTPVSPFLSIDLMDPDSPDAFVWLDISFEPGDVGRFDDSPHFEWDGNKGSVLSGSIGAATEAIRSLQFVPFDNFTPAGGSTVVTFQIRVQDRGESATVNRETEITIHSLNDPPQVDGWVSRIQILEKDIIFPFESISIQDLDGPHQLLTTRLTLDDADAATMTPLAGMREESPGHYVIEANAETTTGLLRKLAFKPAENRVLVTLTETIVLSVEVVDSFGASSGVNVIEVESLSVNDPPTITGFVHLLQTNDNENLKPFATMRFLDPDLPPHFVFITVRLKDPAKGGFELLNGFTPIGGGVFEFFGDLEECSDAIQGMVLNPRNNQIPVGESETIELIVRVRDRLGDFTEIDAITVVSHSVNDPARMDGLSLVQSVDDNGFIHPFEGVDIVDPDPGAFPLTLQLTSNLSGHADWETTSEWLRADSGQLSKSGTPDELGQALKALKLLPKPNRFPVGTSQPVEIAVQLLEDSGVASDTKALRIDIHSANDIPYITGEIKEYEGEILYRPFSNITVHDDDIPAATLKYGLKIDPPAAGTFAGFTLLQRNGPGNFEFQTSDLLGTQEIRRLVFLTLQDSSEEERPGLSYYDRDNDGRSDEKERLDGTDPEKSASFFNARLGLWRFNRDDLAEESGTEPFQILGSRSVLGKDETGVHIGNAERAGLKYPVMDADGNPLINVRQGSVRFWFRPDWMSLAIGGNGPGDFASLIEIGKWEQSVFTGWWALQISPDGNFIRFDAQSDLQQKSYFIHPIQWQTGVWYEILLCYDSKATQLYINDQLVVSGHGLIHYPSQSRLEQNGLNVGGDREGFFPAHGTFDHLETYNYVVGSSEEQIGNGYFSVTAEPGAAGFLLEWKEKVRTGSTLQRKRVDQENWEVLASNTQDWSYWDPDIETNTRYEYRLGNRYALAVYDEEEEPSRGHVYILVDETLHSALIDELKQFEMDLVGDGWMVNLETAPRHDDVIWANNPPKIEELKNRILNENQRMDGQLHMIVLIGHVPIPFSGMISPDGHAFRPWPVDGYYGDLIGSANWTDSRSLTANAPSFNEPNDGIFDQSSFPSRLEAAVGRIDFANLPAFQTAPNSSAGGNYELERLRSYFRRNHLFRLGQMRWSPQVVTESAYNQTALALNRMIHARAWSYASKFFGSSTAGVKRGDLFAHSPPALWGEQGGFASRVSILCCGDSVIHTTDQLAQGGAKANTFFFNLEGSYLGEWHLEDNFLRAALASSDVALGAFWARGYSPRLEAMALGETIGQGMLHTANDLTQFRLLSNLTVNFMGDPTLSIHIVQPPQQVQAETIAGRAKITWTAQTDASYLVLRSDNGIKGPYIKQHESPLTQPVFEDPIEYQSETVYQIRSRKREFTGGGSYFNLSQAVFVQP